MFNAVWNVFKHGVSDIWSRLIGGDETTHQIISAQSGMIKFLQTGLMVLAGLLVLGFFVRKRG